MADETKRVLPIEDEMRSSFLDYAMSVIVSRALPDARDGLKPVHRRILYAMHLLRNTHAQPYKKSARVVGDVIGKYHPHGDSAVYDALVRLAQDFSMRYPLVDGQGNFGSIDGDAPAAMRYTEVRMSKLAAELLADIDKDTVDFSPNYDEKELEPTVLPTRIPNLLLNGAVGIAVGMATNIPPHNLRELMEAAIALVDRPETTLRELLDIVQGPDFPTGGIIMGRAGIMQAYATGRGSITVRARCEIEEDDKGREAIVITEIPYQVNKSTLIEKIAALVRDKRIEGISDIQDYSDRSGMRIWIQVKKDAAARIVLNQLYKHTDLQTTFGVNMIAIVEGRPRMLNLREALDVFLEHRRTVVTRRSEFELARALERKEIVEGLGVAVDAIDRVIEIIRAAKDPEEAKARLCAEPFSGFAAFLERCGRPADEVEAAREGPYRLSERQAKAILDMRLQRLTGLEREKIEGEYRELCGTIARLRDILGNEATLLSVIRDELVEIRDTYGDDRRTEISEVEDEITPIDLVPDEPMVVMLTRKGYVKRIPTDEYRVQRRGGVGVRSGRGRDEDDFVTTLFEAGAHAFVLMFTNTGRVFRKRVFELPKARRDSPGRALVNFLALRDDERVIEMVSYREEALSDTQFIVTATARGYVKRTPLSEYSNIRSTGLIALSIDEGDRLMDVRLTDGDSDLLLSSAHGMSIRFDENDVRPMGRTARGVRGMALREGDVVISMNVVESEAQYVLSISERGYGKRTPVGEYRRQSRAGLGLKNLKVSERNGPVAATLLVYEGEQIIVVTDRGKTIRVPADDVSILGRNTQGVRIIRIREDERVVAATRVVEDADGEEDPDGGGSQDAQEPQEPEAT